MDPTGTRLLKPVPRRVAPCRLSTLSVSSGASSSTRRAPTPSQLWCPGSTKRQFLRRSRVGARPGYQSRAGPTGGIAEGRQRLHLTARPGLDDSRVRSRGDASVTTRHRGIVNWSFRVCLNGGHSSYRGGVVADGGRSDDRESIDAQGQIVRAGARTSWAVLLTHLQSTALLLGLRGFQDFSRQVRSGNWVRRRVLVLLIPVEFLACVGGLLYLLARLEPPREMPRTIRRRPGRVNAPPPPRLRPDERPSRRDRP